MVRAPARELHLGDAAEIRNKRVRKQKTDRQDAQLLLRLLQTLKIEDFYRKNAENYGRICKQNANAKARY